MRVSLLLVGLLVLGTAALAFEADSVDYAPRRLDDAQNWDTARFREMALADKKKASEESTEESSEESSESSLQKVPASAATAESSDESAEGEKESELIRNMHLVATDSDSEKDKELDEALQSVKDQIVHKASQIKSEKKWVHEVTKIIEAYVRKTRRVNADVRTLQNDVKTLLRKKKQIENMIMQRKLESKLRLATVDLATLQAAISGVKHKEDAFSKSKHDIKTTIGALEAELAKLRGRSPAEAKAPEATA